MCCGLMILVMRLTSKFGDLINSKEQKCIFNSHNMGRHVDAVLSVLMDSHV